MSDVVRVNLIVIFVGQADTASRPRGRGGEIMAQRFSSFGWPATAVALALMAGRASGGFTVQDLGIVSTTPAIGPSGAQYPSSGANGINAAGATAGGLPVRAFDDVGGDGVGRVAIPDGRGADDDGE